MLRIRHFVLSLMLVGFSAVPSPGAEPRAMTALKEKGLTRSGRFFVIEAEEASVLEKWKGTRAVLAEYAATAGRRSEAELAARESAQLEERRVALQERLNELNQAINEQGFQLSNNRPGGFGQGAYLPQLIAQRDMIRMGLAEIVATQRSIKANEGPDQKALEEEGKKSLEAARTALAEVRKSVDAVAKRHGELNADASVKSALRALEKDGRGTFKLGPSPAFTAAVKALENAERTILAKKTVAAPRRKGKARR